ncbi:MAG: M67 family metallopeptidase [Planctomycetota bacterium]|jgi:proteasome lid subunit RPN8/RPN11
MPDLKIPAEIYQQMVAQARAAAPLEACGILAGKDSKVEKFHEMTNVDARTNRYMMEPKEQFAAAKDMREAGLEMLAIYHSHPHGSAQPSPTDIRMAFTPNVTHVIVALAASNGPVIKGFLMEDGDVKETPVIIVDS